MKIHRNDGSLIGEFESVKAAIKAGANLAWADLAGANLAGANLAGANLAGANLAGADLAGANLAEANLAGANLAGANLAGANLARANLARANLAGANLAWANLAGANLARANLTGAYLAGANLEISQIPQIKIVPEKGSFVAWKKLLDNKIAELLVPPKAKRTNSTGRKIRVQFAYVTRIIKNKKLYTSGRGLYDQNFVYHTGRFAKADKFDPDFRVECSHGIHCFLTRQEAEEFSL